MESVLAVTDIVLPALLIVLSIGAVFLLFCCAFVWRLSWMPTRWDELAWKRIDYVWIIAGSVVLIIQAVAMNGESKMSELLAEQSLLRMYAQGANMDAAKLSDLGICLRQANDIEALRDKSMVELDRACKRFKEIRPDNATNLILDYRLTRYLSRRDISEYEYKNPEIKERIQRLNASLDQYSEQKAAVQKLSNQVDLYKRSLEVMRFVSYVMLVLAVGLRLAKVKGEINLKINPVPRREEGYVSKKELSITIGSLVSRDELRVLEQKLSSLELSYNRVAYGAGVSIVVLILLASFIFVVSSR